MLNNYHSVFLFKGRIVKRCVVFSFVIVIILISACAPYERFFMERYESESKPSIFPTDRPTPKAASCPTEEMLVYVMEDVIGISPSFAYDPDTPEWDKSYTEYADPNTIGLFSIDIVDGCVVSMGVATMVDRDTGDFTLSGAYLGTIYAIGTEDFVAWYEKEEARCAIADTEKQKTASNGDMWQFSCKVSDDYWINVVTFQSNY